MSLHKEVVNQDTSLSQVLQHVKAVIRISTLTHSTCMGLIIKEKENVCYRVARCEIFGWTGNNTI